MNSFYSDSKDYSYYANNKYFGEYIDQYFRMSNWNKDSSTSKVDYYDNDYFKPICNDCRVVNQLKDVNYLGNKKLQYLNLKKFFNNLPEYVPNTVPFNTRTLLNIRYLFQGGKLFILKPENDSFRNGITIISSYEEAKEWVMAYSRYNSWIIQEFVENSLLYDGKKFHLRIYGVVLKTNKGLQTFVYNNGFMYQGKELYDTNNIKNPNIGLSGENSKDQVKIYPTDFINRYGQYKNSLVTKQIDKIISDTIMACNKILECPNKNIKNYKCFKLLGYDLLVDANFKVWLLEINARSITFKYPPPNYLKNMYISILDLVFKGKEKNFRKVLNIGDQNIVEGFSEFIDNKTTNKHGNIIYIILLISIVVLIILYNTSRNNK